MPRVLVVDDDAFVGRALGRMLSRFCEVQVAGSVSEAEALLEVGEEYNLILCDLLLPERGGAEFYRELAKNDVKSAKKVAFMTGLGPDAREAQEFEGVPCLEKPLNADVVRSLLAERGALLS